MAKTVLIVEDERAIVEILKFNLKREGYETLEALDGQTGLQLAQTEDPDLILLDVMLPKMNGFDICKTLRAENRTTPIIMLTAREEEMDKVFGLETGADDYMTKPFSMKELMARVKANIRRRSMEYAPAQSGAGQIEANGLCLNPETYQVTKNGVPVDLTQKEYDLLMHLIRERGKVFTREELEIIARLAKKYDVYVITDEVYEHIIYAPHQHTYFATLPDMWERTLSCSSLSKTYSITGWRLGYIIAPPEIIDRAKKVHDFLTVGAAAPLQEAIIPGLNFGQDYYDALQAEYTHKKDLFLKGLDDLKIVHNDPEGAYYVMLDISEFGYESDLQFCEDLASEVGVGAVPGSSFFREPVNHLIRLHFAKKDETLTDALNRLESLREKIPAKG